MASCATTGCDDPACRLCTVIAKLDHPGALLDEFYKALHRPRSCSRGAKHNGPGCRWCDKKKVAQSIDEDAAHRPGNVTRDGEADIRRKSHDPTFEKRHRVGPHR